MIVEVVTGGTAPDDVATLHAALRARLRPAAGLPPLLPVAPGTAAKDAEAELTASLARPVPPGTAVLLRTSGSTTGLGHIVALTVGALLASARATHDRLGGPGRWILAVPAHHVAGLQILTRSAVAGHDPVVLDTSSGFDPTTLAALVDRTVADAAGERPRSVGDDAGTLDGAPPTGAAEPVTPGAAAVGGPGARAARTYLSLVPTQLVRALAAGPAVTDALARLDAILVGGAALAPSVRRAAQVAGLRVVRTYGMTETGGGCVYDGRPLDGVTASVDEEGRVWLTGPVLAAGYLDDDDAHADTFVGGRLRTSDSGRLAPDGTLEILGRLDDAITTGGETVAPLAVERRLGEIAEVAECVVVGVPDAEWGEMVAAVVVRADAGSGGPASVAELLAVARAQAGDLSPAHVPRALVVVDRLPLRGPGKIDRRTVGVLAARALGVGDGAVVGAARATDAGVTVIGAARHRPQRPLG